MCSSALGQDLGLPLSEKYSCSGLYVSHETFNFQLRGVVDGEEVV